ncbi:MAG: Holliday junction branch migration DNA helicase RuvB [Erysipelothrix sp.]|nr:Holliday junction branch migration DNA helicase RuvB [Erysipelothrix sp.]
MKEKLYLFETYDEDEHLSLRPAYLSDYVGQDNLISNLKIFIEASQVRNETLDHLLLYGPPGLGKTSLAYILANELKASIKVTSGPSIERIGDLAALLSALNPGDILFIDEIHRVPKQIEEILYSAMEDFELDLIVGKDESARSVRLELPPFTLVGASTKIGNLSSPLRDRFGITSKLEYYSNHELQAIINRTSRVMNTIIDQESSDYIARRSRGTPRIAIRLFRRIRDFALILNNNAIDIDITKHAFDQLKIDSLGLDALDISYLKVIIEKFKGGPVGIDAIASAISEDVMTLEDVYEPYLLQIGFIQRTSRGRIASQKAYEHLNIPYI